MIIVEPVSPAPVAVVAPSMVQKERETEITTKADVEELHNSSTSSGEAEPNVSNQTVIHASPQASPQKQILVQENGEKQVGQEKTFWKATPCVMFFFLHFP